MIYRFRNAITGLLAGSCLLSCGMKQNPSEGSSTTSDYALQRVDNPYAGVTGYVNPKWQALANAEPGGSRISSFPTAVWLVSISSIGILREHLDAALQQGAGYIQFVVYNLPGRDCAALASAGELGPNEIDRYKHDFIDPIAAIQADPKYAKLRIINVVEIDSLPNLVTNVGSLPGATPLCDTMKANGNYVAGVQYALSQLGAIPNVYNYLDAGHHGWLGWDSNFKPSAEVLVNTIKGAAGGIDSVAGFITNTANYSALEEPFLVVNDSTRPSKWIDWNRYVDEKSFAIAFRNQLVASGMKSTIGMLIDTSRNGWGGSNRPSKASTSGDLNQMVNDSRLDRRFHTGNWCNQAGAGLGERPQVVGNSGIHAYVWIKPPGESDGAGKPIPNDEGKGFDRMCDPSYLGNARNGYSPSGAKTEGPLAGSWFSAQFQELMQNAYPRL